MTIKRTKILFVTSTLRKSGPTNQLQYLISNLTTDDYGYEITVLTLSEEPDNSDFRDFVNLQINVESLKLSRINGFLKGPSLLKTKIKQLDPDIIHSQGLRPDILLSKINLSTPHIATLRNYPFDDYPAKFGKLKGLLMAITHVSALKKVSYPVCVSSAIANKMEKHNLKLKVIRNGISEKYYSPLKLSDKKSHAEKLGILTAGKIFISVGSIIKRKDPETLIKGFLNANKDSNHKLVILGEGDLLESLKNKYSDDSLLFKGNVQDVKSYLQIADYFISAAVSEGLPNSVLEALSCGIPSVLSDIEPHKEILNFNQMSGVLYETGNTEQLSDRLASLMTESESEYTTRSNAARKLITDNLSAEVTAKKYINLYRVVLNK